MVFRSPPPKPRDPHALHEQRGVTIKQSPPWRTVRPFCPVLPDEIYDQIATIHCPGMEPLVEHVHPSASIGDLLVVLEACPSR